MMRDIGRMFVLAVILVLMVLLALEPNQAATAWQLKCVNTMEDVVSALQRMPMDAAERAKIIVAPSSRNVLGWAGSPYCIITR